MLSIPLQRPNDLRRLQVNRGNANFVVAHISDFGHQEMSYAISLGKSTFQIRQHAHTPKTEAGDSAVQASVPSPAHITYKRARRPLAPIPGAVRAMSRTPRSEVSGMPERGFDLENGAGRDAVRIRSG